MSAVTKTIALLERFREPPHYYRDLPFGFSAGLEPAFLGTNFNAPLAAFGVTRSDKTWAIKLDLLNRRLEYRGFAPRPSFIYVNQESNIELYRYSRSQIQLGLTRQFWDRNQNGIDVTS